jgi:hypothetical protein
MQLSAAKVDAAENIAAYATLRRENSYEYAKAARLLDVRETH